MAKAKRPVKAKTNKVIEMSGSDPRNGLVELEKEGKGFRVTNSRNGYDEFFLVSTKAVEAYNHQISNTHK